MSVSEPPLLGRTGVLRTPLPWDVSADGTVEAANAPFRSVKQ